MQSETSIITDSTTLADPVIILLGRFDEDNLRDPTHGNLATILNEQTIASRLGIEINQSAIPTDEQMKGACQILGPDPLDVDNKGCLLRWLIQPLSLMCWSSYPFALFTCP